MKEDFKLLKVGTEVCTDEGIVTTINEPYIYRPTSVYFEDAWEKVQEQHPNWDFSEGSVIDYDDRFVEIVSDPWLFTNDIYGDYICLDISKMKPEDINWDEDYVSIDVNENASYERELHDRLQPLWSLELPRNIYDLEDEELEELFNSVPMGSMYYSDYNNKFHVNRKQVLDFCEAFDVQQYYAYVKDEENEDEEEKYIEHLTADEFIEFVRC